MMEDFVKGLVLALDANLIDLAEAKQLLEKYLDKEIGLRVK
jgi:hypothetical protein